MSIILQQNEFMAVPCADLVAHVMLNPNQHSALERHFAQLLYLTMEDEDDGFDA